MSTDKNVNTLERWLELYNNDVHRMIDEFYPDEFSVICPGIVEITSKEQFHDIEQGVLDAAPDRKIRVDRTLAVGDHVIIEAVLHGANPDGSQWESPFCEIFTFHHDLVAREAAYIDGATWPGLGKPH